MRSAQQAEPSKAGGKEREGGWERNCGAEREDPLRTFVGLLSTRDLTDGSQLSWAGITVRQFVKSEL